MIYQKGFTLIEIVVAIAVLIAIVSFGMIADFSSFLSGTFQDEESKIIALLQKARSRSMANMFEARHGVCYIAPDYVIFRNTCVSGALTNELIPANVNISSNPDTNFPAVVFDQLTGNATGATATIHITDGIKSADIIINNEGAIIW